MTKNPKNKTTVKAPARAPVKAIAKPARKTEPMPLPLVSVAPTSRDQKYRIVMRYGDVEHVDELNPFAASARDKFVSAGAQKLGWTGDMSELADHVVAQTRLADDQLAAVTVRPNSSADEKQRLLAATPDDVLEEAERFLNSPDIDQEIIKDFRTLGVVGEGLLSLVAYLIGTSRLLPSPLGGIVQSASSSGKSHITNTAMDMMPPEEVLRATDISPQALYYLPPGSLEHKVVYVAERKHSDVSKDAASANNTLAFRELLSNGKLTKYVTDQGPNGLITRKVEQNGPIAYLETTTQENILEEDQNRLLQLQTDESSDQTARIIKQIAESAATGGGDGAVRARVLAKHHAAQRLLSSYTVIIPFATLLTIPADKVTARRAYGQLLKFIAAVAILRQYRKQKGKGGRIAATVADYKIAYEAMVPILRRSLSPLSERAAALYRVIQAQADEVGNVEPFTREDCMEWSGVSGTEVRTRLKVLEEMDLVCRVDSKIGGSRAYRYELVPEKLRGVKLSGLLTPEVLEERWAAEKDAKKAGTSRNRRTSANRA